MYFGSARFGFSEIWVYRLCLAAMWIGKENPKDRGRREDGLQSMQFR